jgi:hypothetical protein
MYGKDAIEKKTYAVNSIAKPWSLQRLEITAVSTSIARCE